MSKKMNIGVILIIICVIIVAYSIIFVNNVNIGTDAISCVSVPNGFNTTNLTRHSVTLFNDDSSYTIYEFSNKSMKSIFEDYKIQHRNDTVYVNTTVVQGITVSGLNLEINGTYVHTNYFYEKNGITYQIYPTGNFDFEIFKQLVDSTNKKFI